ncbi:MAG: phosphotransferase family protein [Pseudomonadota bacterium]
MSYLQEIENALKALAPQLGGRPGDVEGLSRLSGGASQETWSFDVVQAGGVRKGLILRRVPGGTRHTESETAVSLSTEAALISVAQDAGVPVPAIAHVCAPGDGLGEAYIMARLRGETIARRILRDEVFSAARPVLAARCGDALARIHALPASDLPPLNTSGTLQQLEQYQSLYQGYGARRPVFDLALSWLKRHPPQPRGPVLVHGDFRLGNLMVGPEGLVGVLDWELAHLGDPREDIAWACINAWRFGNSEYRVGGFGALEDLLAAYAAAGGPEFTPEEIDWFEMLGSLKWGVMCMTMYDIYRTGADPSVERAAIGRRVSENEIDLINLIEKVA